MAALIENPAKCELRSVIRFLNAQNVRPIEIYRQIKAVYGDNAMSAIQNKRRGMLSSKVVLIHDNARPHCSARTKAELNSFKWQIFGHPPYSPDLAPSDYHLFPKLKVFLGGKNFLGDEDLKEGVKTWLHSLAAEQYNVGIEKLVPRYNKCLDSSGDFVEK
uniref:Mos1 transposase HTH domain-containing protein n=1 Tax=Homalodisca liturata TaxID=320908 RepID=A0A1B6IVE1_9HEMI